MTKATKKSSEVTLKLPKIETRLTEKPRSHINNKKDSEIMEQCEDDSTQVSQLEEWSINKPTKKTRHVVNTHNVSFVYRNSAIRPQKTRQYIAYGQNYKFMDVQLFIAKIDTELQKISQTNYFSIYKNIQYCSGVYENAFNSLLKTIAKHRITIKTQIDQIQFKLHMERQQHIKKVQELQESGSNHSYKDQINEVRELLEEKEMQIKPLRKILEKIDLARVKVLKYCLSLGYDVREEGLVWIIKELGLIPKPEEFPSFLSNKEISFIITKYTNQHEASQAETVMKAEICGHTINEAYEFVNRRKRRQLSFIKENQELSKLYSNRIKDYSRQKHIYLSDSTLQIAQQIEKQKPKPTRYEVIYQQTTKKLNKICREKIHPQIYSKSNKENQKSKKDLAKDPEFIRRKEKKHSTIIIQEFSKMLNLSINQSKKLDELYTKEEKEFEEILREIRNEKYSESASQRVTINKFDQNSEENKLRNPISILSCLIGWKKAEKIIEQEMFGF